MAYYTEPVTIKGRRYRNQPDTDSWWVWDNDHWEPCDDFNLLDYIEELQGKLRVAKIAIKEIQSFVNGKVDWVEYVKLRVAQIAIKEIQSFVNGKVDWVEYINE